MRPATANTLLATGDASTDCIMFFYDEPDPQIGSAADGGRDMA